MKDAFAIITLIVFDGRYNRRRNRVEIPNIMRDILEVANILARLQSLGN